MRQAPDRAAPLRKLNLSVVDHNAIELSPRISEADVADYIALLKPRVMSLVIFTALVGLVMAPGHFHPAGSADVRNDAGVLLGDDARHPDQLVRRRAARVYDLLLCRDLHDRAEALDRAEHRDRRRR